MVQNMLVLLSAVVKDRKGISALEYAVLAVGIITAIAVGAANVGGALSGVFVQIVSDL